jgi:hypothetical protein
MDEPVSKRYAVADILTPEQKARILSHEFALAPISADRVAQTLCARITNHLGEQRQVCPIGVALGFNFSPGAARAARALDRGGDQAVIDALYEFMCDVDSGQILPENLKEAIGG